MIEPFTVTERETYYIRDNTGLMQPLGEMSHVGAIVCRQ
jgi:hypothetical protein